jgi:acetyl esterase/lipase
MTKEISNLSDTTKEPYILRLWEQDAPGALGKDDKDIPTLTFYMPDPTKATGAGIVVCPGGGYHGLAPHEAGLYALWLNAQGIAGIVLKYRLASGGYHYPAMFYDVTRAMRYVRFLAKEKKLDPNRIGVMGSSAGGHLSSLILTQFDNGQQDATDPVERYSSRPNLGILCYPVISMNPEIGHAGCKNSLMGTNTSPDLTRLLSTELQVKFQTPPCFVWHTYEDGGVKVENSVEFAAALRKSGVPYELHVYQKGAHGLGLGTHEYKPEQFHPWTWECARWLKEQGFGKGFEKSRL